MRGFVFGGTWFVNYAYLIVLSFFLVSGRSGGGGVTYWQQGSWAFVPRAAVAVGRAASLVFLLSFWAIGVGIIHGRGCNAVFLFLFL